MAIDDDRRMAAKLLRKRAGYEPRAKIASASFTAPSRTNTAHGANTDCEQALLMAL